MPITYKLDSPKISSVYVYSFYYDTYHVTRLPNVNNADENLNIWNEEMVKKTKTGQFGLIRGGGDHVTVHWPNMEVFKKRRKTRKGSGGNNKYLGRNV